MFLKRNFHHTWNGKTPEASRLSQAVTLLPYTGEVPRSNLDGDVEYSDWYFVVHLRPSRHVGIGA